MRGRDRRSCEKVRVSASAGGKQERVENSRHQRKDRHGVATTLRIPHVRNDTSRVGERRRGEATAEKAEDDERADVGR